MKTIIILLIILMTSPVYAAQRYFWTDTKPNFSVTDVSGKHTKQQIIDQYNLNCTEAQLQMIELDENTESARILEDGTLTKYNYIEENSLIAEQREIDEKTEEEGLRTEMGWTKEQLKQMKKVFVK